MPVVCVCKEWPETRRCFRDATAEDFLCDTCRAGCARLTLADHVTGHVEFGAEVIWARATAKSVDTPNN